MQVYVCITLLFFPSACRLHFSLPITESKWLVKFVSKMLSDDNFFHLNCIAITPVVSSAFSIFVIGGGYIYTAANPSGFPHTPFFFFCSSEFNIAHFLFSTLLIFRFPLFSPPKGGRGCLMSPSCLESQGCYLIPLCCLLSCSSA